MDALGLVRQDHRRLEALLERCERTDHDDPEERTVLLAQLNAALRHHVDEEEALLYPAFPQPDNDLLARGVEQHHRITALAQELTTIPPTSTPSNPSSASWPTRSAPTSTPKTPLSSPPSKPSSTTPPSSTSAAASKTEDTSSPPKKP